MIYNSRFGQSIFDIVTVLNIGIDNIISVAVENNVNDLTVKIPAKTTFVYSKTQQITVGKKNVIPFNPIGKFKSITNQSIFDISVMLNGGMDSIVEFALINGINSLTDNVNVNTQFTYTNGIAITAWCLKNNYIFANKKKIDAIPNVYIIYQTWKDINDVYWLITVNSNNIVSSIETSPTTDYITSQLWIDIDNELWTVTIDTNGIFSALNSGTGDPLTSEIWSNGSGLVQQTIDLNGNFQFN